MAAASKKLGRGLSALLAEEYSENPAPGESTESSAGVGLRDLSVKVIQSGKYQPRTYFDDSYIKELADSIKKSGVMQPIVVRPIDSETAGVKYEIIAGERRWRAAQMAGEYTIPAIIREVDDQQALELALIENVQRQDLNPLEEARGYQRLVDEFAYTQEELASTIGKSRSHIANLLRLLNLPEEVKNMIDKGQISMGHAKALMASENPIALANQVISRGLNVRQTENLARGDAPKAERTSRSPSGKGKKEKAAAKSFEAAAGEASSDAQLLAATVAENLKLRKVEIEEKGEEGRIILYNDTMQELDTILQHLSAA